MTVSSAHAGDNQDGTITVTGANDPPSAPAVANHYLRDDETDDHPFAETPPAPGPPSR